jgi:hypothetical protein
MNKAVSESSVIVKKPAYFHGWLSVARTHNNGKLLVAFSGR